MPYEIAPEIKKRMSIERRVVRKLIRVAKAHGYALTKIYDGEVMEKISTETEALEVVFSVDDCTMYFKHPEQTKGHCAVIVLGNDGWDAIADCSMGEGWDDVIKEVFDYCDALSERYS